MCGPMAAGRWRPNASRSRRNPGPKKRPFHKEENMAVYDWNTIEPESVTDLYQRKVAQGHQLSVARLEVGKGSITHAHRHPHEEVIVLLQGRWLFRFADREVVL